MRIGVLALQGSFIEHFEKLKQIDYVDAILVKTIDELNMIDGLIIPGGESTAIARLLHVFGLFEPLKEKIKKGLPVWGTCAGLILLAKEIDGEKAHFGLLEARVRRNGFGRQNESFAKEIMMTKISDKPIIAVFIRAPRIISYTNDVEVLAFLNQEAVAVRQNNVFGTTFHPELTSDLSFLKYFIQYIKNLGCD